MKIGIDGRVLEHDKIEGFSRFLLNFLRSDAASCSDYELIIFCNHKPVIDFKNKRARIVIIPEGWRFAWDQLRLPLALKKEKIDLFFSPYYKAPFFSPCKFVVTFHDTVPFLKLIAIGEYNFLKIWLIRFYEKIIAAKASKILTVSKNSKDDLVVLFRIPEAKIVIVSEAVEERFHPVSDLRLLKETCRRYNIDCEYLLYVGNFKPRKNIEAILKAYRGLSLHWKDKYKLVIAGRKDKFFAYVAGLVEKSPDRERVIFTDFIQDVDLPVIYSAAEVFIFPSLYEGFGLPVLEAMACGTAVICSNASSLPEVTNDAAILINPHNPEEITLGLSKILSEKPFKEALIKKGLERAREFSLDKSAQEILNVFNEVLNL